MPFDPIEEGLNGNSLDDRTIIDYWKYNISIPSYLSGIVKPALEGRIFWIQDTIWITTLTDEIIPYIEENYKEINGIHLTPFMTEQDGLDGFAEKLNKLIDWIIYKDKERKLIDNFIAILPSEVYSQCVSICNKQVYISKWDVRWPIAKYCCFNLKLAQIEGVCSLDDYNHAQFLCSTSLTYEMEEYSASEFDPPNGERPISSRSATGGTGGGTGYKPYDAPFVYDGDFFVLKENLPEYGFEIPEDESSGGESDSGGDGGGEVEEVLYYRIIGTKTWTLTFDTRFATTIGLLCTGVATGNYNLSISYKCRPDLTKPI